MVIGLLSNRDAGIVILVFAVAPLGESHHIIKTVVRLD
jgi:hypothetical protein